VDFVAIAAGKKVKIFCCKWSKLIFQASRRGPETVFGALPFLQSQLLHTKRYADS